MTVRGGAAGAVEDGVEGFRHGGDVVLCYAEGGCREADLRDEVVHLWFA